jgi:hypothetical protein
VPLWITEVESADVSTPIVYEPAMVGFVAVTPMPASTVTGVAAATESGDVIVTLLGFDCVGRMVTAWALTE